MMPAAGFRLHESVEILSGEQYLPIAETSARHGSGV